MATKLFNYTNQRLNADKLREVQAFNSDNFAGIISKDLSSPFSVSGNVVTLVASENPVSFLGGGVLLNQADDVYCTLLENNKLWYLEVTLDADVATILNDNLIEVVNSEIQIDRINFKSTVCSSITTDATYTYFTPTFEASGNPSESNYYEYDDNAYVLSSDTEVDATKIYYVKIEASRILFQLNEGTPVYSYLGNTIWTSDSTFIIPLFAKIDNELVQTIIIRTLSDFENLMSMESFSRLKSYVDGTFVWSCGGRETVLAPDGTTHRKGDIGGLNITGDTIYNNINYGTDANPDYHDPVKIQNLTINNLASVSNDVDTKLVVDTDGNITAKSDYILPIIHGGTGANNRTTIKKNLGIFYGTTKPQQSPPTTTPQEGDIYLWIIE